VGVHILHDAEGEIFHVTLSAGIAALDPVRMELDTWRDAADRALYAAKAEGRNRVIGAPPPAHARTAPGP